MRRRYVTFIPTLLALTACGGGPPPASPTTNGAAKEEASGSETPSDEGQAEAEIVYPESTPKELGTINGKKALFKHAYIARPEKTYQLQAFTYDDVTAKEVCPEGLRFISEGSMLQVDFLEETSQTDPSRFYVQTDKPDVKVTKASARIQGTPKPGTKVLVDVDLEGSNKTKLKGAIEAVVCAPHADSAD